MRSTRFLAAVTCLTAISSTCLVGCGNNDGSTPEADSSHTVAPARPTAGPLPTPVAPPPPAVADDRMNRMKADMQLRAFGMLTKAYALEHGNRLPKNLTDLREMVESGDPPVRFHEIIVNPHTGDDPGYELANPGGAYTGGHEAMIYQLREGERDASLRVAYQDGSIGKYEAPASDMPADAQTAPPDEDATGSTEATDVPAAAKPALDPAKAAQLSEHHIRALASATNAFAIKSGSNQLPQSLEDLSPTLGKHWEEAITNPVTGDKPGYELANPGGTTQVRTDRVLIYQLRDGKRDTTLPVVYEDNRVGAYEAENF